MIKALLMIFIGFAFPAMAQTTSVTSGEHEGFSRIVLNYSSPVNWSLNRTDTGYVLRTTNPATHYDLSDVYRRLTHTRLAKIVPEDKTGNLQLYLDCECHAVPFELRSGVLVIDLKDGQAPEGSSFEIASNGSQQPPLAKRGAVLIETVSPLTTKDGAVHFPKAFIAAIEGAARISQDPQPVLNPNTAPTLEKNKEDLLWQLSKGVAAGVVDPAHDLNSNRDSHAKSGGSEHIGIGANASLDESRGKSAADHMTGLGNACFADSQLDITLWGGEGDPTANFAESTTDLVGEFDRPDDNAISRSVRYNLSLGFGAEARQIMNALKVSLPDRKIWETMSYILDLQIPPGSVFSGMEVCDTSASFWAALAVEALPPTNQVEIPAILRTFSSLPLNLRRHLGPGLASRFLARDDPATARAIRDAILRAPGAPNSSVQLLEAKIELANGDNSTAEAILSPLAGGSDPIGLQSTIILIHAQTAEGMEVSVELTTTAEALLEEAKGGENEEYLRESLALAYASQNRYQAAFDMLPEPSGGGAQIWKMLADQGNDDAILLHAVFQTAAELPVLPDEIERKLARRLLDLGFPDPALKWLKNDHRTPGSQTAHDLLLIAEADIARNDNINALAQLETLEGAPANILRAKALASLQSPDAIAQLVQTGQQEEAARAAREQNAWAELMLLAPGGIWQEAANLIETPKFTETEPKATAKQQKEFVPGNGLLAKSRASLEESTAARAVLERLMSEGGAP